MKSTAYSPPHLLLDKHESVRGSQYAAQAYRALLGEHGLIGSMGRRGNPYDNAMMESFMKTLKVEGVYPTLTVVGVCIPWRDAHMPSGRKNRSQWQEHKAWLAGFESLP